MHFHERKVLCFIQISVRFIIFRVAIDNESALTNSGNGLVPNRRQAITSINADQIYMASPGEMNWIKLDYGMYVLHEHDLPPRGILAYMAPLLSTVMGFKNFTFPSTLKKFTNFYKSNHEPHRGQLET